MFRVYYLKDKSKTICYVGQTKQTLGKRLKHHQCKFPEREYETIHLIGEVPTQESAFIMEAMMIQQYETYKLWNKSTGYDETHKTRDHYREDKKDKTNGFYKHKQSEHAKRVLSERSKGNQYAKGNKGRTGRKNSDFWKKRITETKSKKVMCLETGIVYNSVKQAAKELGLQNSKISNVCNGKRKTTGGLTFRFV